VPGEHIDDVDVGPDECRHPLAPTACHHRAGDLDGRIDGLHRLVERAELGVVPIDVENRIAALVVTVLVESGFIAALPGASAIPALHSGGSHRIGGFLRRTGPPGARRQRYLGVQHLGQRGQVSHVVRIEIVLIAVVAARRA